MKRDRAAGGFGVVASWTRLGRWAAGAAAALILWAVAAGTAAAQPGAAFHRPDAPATAATAATAATPVTPATSAAVATGASGFDPRAATAAYLARLSPEARAKSDAYFEGGYWILLWGCLINLAFAWWVLASGWSARLRDRIEAWTGSRWLQTGAYALIYVLVYSLVTLPWDIYESYVREHQYGMSNQTLAAFLIDDLKGLGIALIFGGIAAVAIYAVLRKAPRTWWLWGSLVAIAFAAFAAAVAPVYLEPVFNRFERLPESPLKESILSLARANEIPATDVYQYDASKQTKRMSAHVSGLMGTTRISLNDNLLQRASSEEIVGVVGHEMGHYVLHHVYKGMLFAAVIIVVGFGFLRWGFERLRLGHLATWRIRGIDDVAGMPLAIALFAVYGFLLTPVLNTVGREMEHEADNYSLNTARQPDGFAQAALHLSEYRKLTPGPIEEAVFYDHPSGWHRIYRAMEWKAEHLHDPDIAAYDAAHPGTPGIGGALGSGSVVPAARASAAGGTR